MRITFFFMVLLSFLIVKPGLYPAKYDYDYFSREEMDILANTTKSLGFEYGYDFEINLVYIFTITFNKDDTPEKSKNFKQVLGSIKKEILIKFYQKIYKLREITLYKIERFQDKSLWKNYTYLGKYILPHLNRYMGYFEKEIQAIDPSYMTNAAGRHKELTTEAKKIVKDEEHIEKIRLMEKTRRRRWKI